MNSISKEEFITKAIDKNKVYEIFLTRLNNIEQSTISVDATGIERARENSMDMVFKLFPVLEAIAENIANKKTRNYLQELGYSKTEANLIYSMFRNGFMHNFSPYHYVYDNGEISWGLMSSSGSSGFPRHFPGYKSDDPRINQPADKAFTYVKIDEKLYHASLSLNALVSHLKYDLSERLKNDKRTIINIIVGKRFKGEMPSVK